MEKLPRVILVRIALVLGLSLSLGAWAFSSPVGSSPDDDFHLASIWCAGSGVEGMCSQTADASTRLVSDSLTKSSCFASDAKVSAGCQQSLSVYTTTDASVTTRGSFTGNYPPVYYSVMHLLAGHDVQFSALMMRLLNISLFIGFMVAALVLFSRSLFRPLVGTWAITMVPLGLFLVASNNPSSWAIIGIGFGWAALLAFYQATPRLSLPSAILFIVATIVAAGARGDSAVYVVISVALVTFLSFRNTKKWWIRSILPAVMSIVAVAFFLASQQSAIASTGLAFGAEANPSEGRSGLSVLFFNLVQLPYLLSGVFGTWNLGWLDTVMPGIVWVPSLAAFSALIFSALHKVDSRRLIALAGVSIVIICVPIYVLQMALAKVGEQVQPRYVFPLIILFAGIALLSFSRESQVFSRTQLLVIFAGLSVAQSVALYMNTRRYVWGFESSSGWNLNSSPEWWWSFGPSPMLNWAMGSLGFALFLFAVGSFFHASQAKIDQGELLSK